LIDRLTDLFIDTPNQSPYRIPCGGDDRFRCFDTIYQHVTDGKTDGRTDIGLSLSHFAQLRYANARITTEIKCFN